MIISSVYTVFRASRVTFFLVNRVEKPKRTQTATEVLAVWVRFGFQLGLRKTLALIIIKTSSMGQIEELLLKLSHNRSAL